MKRLVILGFIAIAGMSLTISAFQAPPPGPSATAVAATKIEKVKDNLYVITGSGVADNTMFSGGNTAVFVTDTGVVLVDTKLPGWGPTILERVKTVTNKPVTMIINTHTHGDHTGSNEFFGATVESVVHENTAANMAKMDAFKGEKAKFLPKRTYKDRLTIGEGKDEIDLYYFGAAHTNGDTVVGFPALRTIHAGDIFSWKAVPLVDQRNGGSMLAYPQTLAKTVDSIKNVDTVITGHIAVSTWNDLKEYAAFTGDFVAWGRNQMNAGKTVDQAVAEYKVPEKYKGYLVEITPRFGLKPALQILYDELKK